MSRRFPTPPTSTLRFQPNKVVEITHPVLKIFGRVGIQRIERLHHQHVRIEWARLLGGSLPGARSKLNCSPDRLRGSDRSLFSTLSAAPCAPGSFTAKYCGALIDRLPVKGLISSPPLWLQSQKTLGKPSVLGARLSMYKARTVLPRSIPGDLAWT